MTQYGVSPDRYRTIFIPKRSGGVRRIDVPDRALLDAQRRILRVYLDKLSVSVGSFGLARGRSAVSAAVPHANKRIVVRLDIKDFFNSISFSAFRDVFVKRMRRDHFDHIALCAEHRMCSSSGSPWSSRMRWSRGACLGWFLRLVRDTCFVSMRDPIDVRHVDSDESVLRLPQGFATSPALANLFMRRVDDILGSVALNRYNAHYTRYADDLMFSSPVIPGRRALALPKIVVRIRSILRGTGLALNKDKVAIMRSGHSQRMLGLCVNGGVALSRRYRKNLRAAKFQVSLGRQIDARLRGEIEYERMVARQAREPVMTYYAHRVLEAADGGGWVCVES
jgi:hypothetical protein